jgi:hypothetical protein
MLKNKRSQNLLSGTIIFVIMNALFFGIMLIFISQAGTGADALEKIYSRQVALAVDNMKPGTEVQLYLPKLFDMADANKLKTPVLSVDYNSCQITVRSDAGDGNSYYCFGKINSIIIDISNKTITLKS